MICRALFCFLTKQQHLKMFSTAISSGTLRVNFAHIYISAFNVHLNRSMLFVFMYFICISCIKYALFVLYALRYLRAA